MDILYDKLKRYTIKDIYNLEEKDRQFLALKKIKTNKNILFLYLILINSLICYQLSGSWEDYWEEFSESININIKKIKTKEDIFNFFSIFLINSKNNKRFIKIKLKRIKKALFFYDDFLVNYNIYIKDLELLRKNIAFIMNQKRNSKTIVFSIKMFSYWVRIVFNKFVKIPNSISIPIDSRLIKIFEYYKWSYKDIEKFYFDLSNKLKIPPLNLDSLLWINYKQIIKWV